MVETPDDEELLIADEVLLSTDEELVAADETLLTAELVDTTLETTLDDDDNAGAELTVGLELLPPPPPKQ